MKISELFFSLINPKLRLINQNKKYHQQLKRIHIISLKWKQKKTKI